MAAICDRPDCSAAVALIDDNGATDPSVTRVETYECEHGHEFVEVLEPL